MILTYIFIPIAIIFMIKNYEPTTWVWFLFLVASFFVGVAPFIAIAYLFTLFLTKERAPSPAPVYHADGSYTVYKADTTKAAASPGKMAFRIIGSLVAGATICVGLFFVGILVFVSISCGGNSKCM